MGIGVEIKNLKKAINGFQLGPLDLQFEAGTITAIVGKNGAGKSTLAKLLMNLAKPDAGEIVIEGEQVSFFIENWKRKIAYQPQSLLGCNAFNGSELKGLIAPLYPSWDEELFQHLVKVFDIPLNKSYGKLTPGVQQQLNLALTLPRDTDVLLLDEPTAHMDIPAKQLLTEELVSWMERGEKTMIIVSHQVEDIRKLADYIVIIHKGQVVEKATKDELVQSYKRYWMEQPLPEEPITAEIERKNNHVFISNEPISTEEYLTNKGMHWLQTEPLELDEIISLLMKEK